MLIVYRKPNCTQCDATKRWLEKHEVPFDTKEIEDHPEILAEAKARGVMSAPIVVTDDGSLWGGFRTGDLKEYKKRLDTVSAE